MSDVPLASGTEAANARLDRLERESFRRKWDSTVLSAAQRAQRDSADSLSTVGPAPTLDSSFVGLLSERLNRLEQKASRLEREFARLERRQRPWKRVGGTLILATIVAIAVTTAQSWLRAPTRPAGGPESSLASLIGWGP